MDDFIVAPDRLEKRLICAVAGIDQTGEAVETKVPVEIPLTLYLNDQEIVAMMTIGDHPEDLALGYLLNQNMPRPGEAVTGIDLDDEMGVVIVHTAHRTNFEAKLPKKTQTSCCAQGTAFRDVMERLPHGLAAAEAWLKWPISP